MPFIENQGQIKDSSVKYSVQTFVGNAYVCDGGVVYALTSNKTGWGVSECYQGNNNVSAKGIEPTTATVNYFKGNDSITWQNNLDTYQQIQYKNLYDGIDLNLMAHGKNIEKIFTVKPGAQPNQIQIQINGSNELQINSQGELEIQTGLGNLLMTKPIAYQTINNQRIDIPIWYTLTGNTYGYQIGSYNNGYDLIIDPLLASTYLGGDEDSEWPSAIAIDQSGNIFITGYTSSSDFPTTTGVYDTSFNGEDDDVFVSKFNNNLTQLLASTYIGGTGDASWNDFEDMPTDILVDSNGNIYITGHTYSPDYPTTTGAYDNVGGSYSDSKGFITKLNNNLNSILASTFIGGSDGYNDPEGIAIDSTGNIYITGGTMSSDFPTTSGAYDRSIDASTGVDGFVSKFNSNLSQLLASTYIGGSRYEYPSAISIDQSGNVFITGNTDSSDFPTTSGAYDQSYNGDDEARGDAFVSKFSCSLTSLMASTFVGGAKSDEANDLVIDNSGNVIICGQTRSNPGNNGNDDVFITKLDNSLSSELANAFIGSSDNDSVNAITCDTVGNIYITGHTYKQDFPTTTGAYDTTINGVADQYSGYSYPADVFVSKFNNALSTVLASTFLGGSDDDYASDIKVDSNGNVIVTGFTDASFPTTTGAYDTSSVSGDVFVSKFDSNLSASDTIHPTVTSIDPVSNAVNVARNKVITVTFSESIKAGNLWIELFNGSSKVPLTMSVSGSVLTISHAALLAPGTKYTLALHTGSVTDLVGNSLAGVSRYFTTSTDAVAPTLKSIDPLSNAVNVARNKVITVTFSESIKAGNLWIELYNTVGTKALIPITTSISGNVLTINHAALLTPGTKFTLALHTGSVTDLAGNSLAGVSGYFTTIDDTAPTVKSIDPVNNAVNVARNKVIPVTFSEPIKAGNLWIELFNGSSKVPLTMSVSGSVLTISHAALLALGTKYTLALHTGSVTDLAGNSLAGVSRVFTTGTT